MKKKLVVFFMFCLFYLLPLNVSALDSDTYVDWELDRTIFVHQLRNGEDHVTNLAIIKANGVVSYCIEPGVLADKASMYNSTSDITKTQLGNVDTRYMSLVGYYGYGYEGHNQREYYMASQELIWERMGVDDVWFSDAKTGGNIIDVSYEKEQILSKVNAYEITPKFNFKNWYIVGDEVLIEDINNVLNEFEILGNVNNVTISGNSLKIKVKEGNNSFTLSRKSNNNKIKFYYKNGYQTIGSFEGTYDLKKEYQVTGVYGKIIVNKYDFDNKSKVPSSKLATLEGAIYTLYDENEKEIESKATNKDGVIVFDKLPKGSYTVKETKPSPGYTLDRTVFRTYLAAIQLSVNLKSYDKVITNKIIINKVLDDNENKLCIPEEGVKFAVYEEDGTLFNEYITNEEGVIEIFLPYGNYVVKQITSPPGVDKVEDFLVRVNDDGIENTLTLVNKKIEKPKKPEEPESYLPNTGKHSNILFLIFINAFSLVGYLHEKKMF